MLKELRACSLAAPAICLALLTSACRLELSVPQQGQVDTLSGNFACAAGQRCEIDVDDASFAETFVANPLPGCFFEAWRSGPGYFCGGPNKQCVITTAFFAGNQPLLNLLEADLPYFMEPRFADYTLVRANDYVSIEGEVAVQNVAYSRTEGSVSFDANDDGLMDLLMGPSNFAFEPKLSLALFINQGGGVYVEDAAGTIDNVPLVGFINHPSLVADFNGDGADDVFLVDQGLEIGLPPFAGEQPILLLSNGSGGLSNASFTHLPDLSTEFHHSADIGDVDGDGDLDIAVVTLSELRVYILENDGAGRFSLRTQGLPQELVTEEANRDLGAITLTDTNGDQRLDLVFGIYKNEPGLEVIVALQTADGAFLPSQTISLEKRQPDSGIDLILAADLDGDGDEDLVGKIDESLLDSEVGEALGGLGMFIFRNEAGRYVDVTRQWLRSNLIREFLPDENVAGFYLQDVNDDKHLDLVFARNIPLEQLGSYILLNNGSGKFSPAAELSLASDIISVGPVWYNDYDGDGDTDIVAMYPDVNQVDGNFISSGYEIVVIERDSESCTE